MSVRWRFASLLILIAVGAVSASPARADFGSSHVEKWCGPVADRTPDGCQLDGTASAESGDMSVSMKFTSPGGGLLPWAAFANASSYVVAPAVHLDSPAPEVDFTSEIHLDRASISFKDPTGDKNVYHWLHTLLRLSARHADCSACTVESYQWLLSTKEPGSWSTADHTYVIRTKLVNNDGGDIPAGDITVEAGATITDWQFPGVGDDAASIEAQVLSIARE